ncbi:MAG: heavy metal translocating P-type ATPase [Pseudomonadota bacterium]|nr:heavy metal translocating P-type ATPase [Pseudomonadota bacterium]
MNARLAHLALLAIALTGLVAGMALLWTGRPEIARHAWGAATVPVIAGLALAIVRDLARGMVGVDAIALLSMATALFLGEPLAGVVVAVMYAGGNVLEHHARRRAELNLRALTDRTPRTARRVRDGAMTELPVAAVRVGDELFVGAGEVLPVDGTLASETATIDESALTGEALPVRHQAGDALRSGTVNAGEAFGFIASAEADDSTYAGIVRMVEAAYTARAPFIRLADRFALLLLPVTVAVAGAAWLLSGDPVRALAVLVVATPCPLILAAPIAMVAGVSRAAHAGVLMKGGAALEALSRARSAVFDKTGTLTEGGAHLVRVDTAPGVDADAVLALAASLEQASTNVLAQALVRAARDRALALLQPHDVVEHRGSGIEGLVDGSALRIGSRDLVLGGKALPRWAGEALAPGGDVNVVPVFVAVNGKLAAVLTLRDLLRGEAAATLRALRANGIERITMLTGDSREAAGAIGGELDLDEIWAHQSPADKVEKVRRETALAPTMMIGDGINDAPALAAATVGVAMGAKGATASSEAADVVILVDRLDRVGDALAIARRSRAIAMQSIVAGLALSGVAMIFAALGHLTPVAGALLQEGIDVAVILNALRALGGIAHGSKRTVQAVG